MTFSRFPDNRSSDGESEAANVHMTELGEEASARRLMGDAEQLHPAGADEEEGREEGVFGQSESLPGRGITANAAPGAPKMIDNCLTLGKKVGVAIPVMDSI